MLEVFDNDSIRRILRVRRRDCVPFMELRRRLCLTSIPAPLVQRRLRWLSNAARRPEGELIKDLLLLTPPRTWCRRAGGQLKTWATTIKDRRAWSASVRDMANAIGDAGSTHPG